MINPNTDKSLTEVLDLYIQSFSKVLNCIKIGEIVDFDKSTQTATIKILHKEKNDYYEYNNKLIDYPLLL